MSGALGYVFWHAPADGDGGYAGVVEAWHDALAADRPDGLLEAWTWRLRTPPWLAGWPDAVHLDLYVVDGFAGLGTLNATAPAGSRRTAHDGAAARAAWGAGALMAHVSGPPGFSRAATLSWCGKERGRPYADAFADLAAPGRAVWCRQMVLGAGPELLVVDPPPGAAAPGAVWTAAADLVAATPPRGAGRPPGSERAAGARAAGHRTEPAARVSRPRGSGGGFR